MHRQSQYVLFGYALYLLLCGLAGYALSGIDAQVHIHGVRLALAIGVCAMIAGRVDRTRTLAVLAIDISALLILAAARYGLYQSAPSIPYHFKQRRM